MFWYLWTTHYIFTLYNVARTIVRESLQSGKFNEIKGLIFPMAVMGPLQEELFFRTLLTDLLAWCGFSEFWILHISTLSFGISHVFNFIVLKDFQGVKLLIFNNVLNAIFAGYFFYSLPRYWNIPAHMVFNIIGLIVPMIMIRVMRRRGGISTTYGTINGIPLPEIHCAPIRRHSMNRKCDERTILVKDLPADLKKSFDKFDQKRYTD